MLGLPNYGRPKTEDSHGGASHTRPGCWLADTIWIVSVGASPALKPRMAKLPSHRHVLATRPRPCRDAQATAALVVLISSSCFGARDVMAAGKAPCARVGHAMCAAPAGCGTTGVKDDDRTLLIFGGGDGTRGFGDLLLLTLPREGAPPLLGQSVRVAHLYT